MAWWFDRPLLNTLTRSWDESAINNYSERVRRHEEAISAPIAARFQIIDAKSTGLLTHASMMIAGLGLIAPLVADHNFEEAVIIFEMAVYLLIAVGCLRCLSVFNAQELTNDTTELPDRIGRELLLRRELYGPCSRVAIIFTILVLVTLPALYFW